MRKGRRGITAKPRHTSSGPSQGPELRTLCVWAVVACGVCLFIGHLLDGVLSEPTPLISRSYAVLPPASERTRAYFAQRTALYVAATIWSLGGLILCARRRVVDRALQLAPRIESSPFLAASAAWIALSTFMALWTMPVVGASTAIERSFGLTAIGPGLWIADRLRDWALDLVWAPLLGLAWVLLRRSPKRWWLWLGCGLVPVGVVMTLAVPVIVDPMYNAYAPMRNERLRAAIADLAKKAGLRDPVVLTSVRSARTKKANAYVTGLGPTHRVVIWDTTLRRMPEDQVAAIAAHELGHYRYRHIWWGLLLYTIGGFAVLKALHATLPALVSGMGAGSLEDPRSMSVAYLGLTMILLIQTPVAAGISRVMERQADAYGLALCGDGRATARALASFSKDDLAHPDPPRALVLWSYTHPPLRERVGRALAFAEGHTDPKRASAAHIHGLPH